MRVRFTSATQLSPAVLTKALNAELSEDLLVFEVAEAPVGFHALRDARSKRYRYVIQDGRLPDLFARKYIWHVYQRLDEVAMRAAATALIGTHDFASYETSGSPRLTTERTVLDLIVERRQAEVLAERDRTKAGMTAPAQGLFLVGVEYPTEEEFRMQNSEFRGESEDSGECGAGME